MGELKQLLEVKGIKPSYQRLRILEYIMKSRDHPSVDTIFRALSKKILTLSRTTIYNTLGLFASKKIVNTLTIVDSELRFDLSKKPHAHFLCTRCKRVYDVKLETEILNLDIVEGHKPDETYLHFKGMCKQCLKNETSRLEKMAESRE